MLQQPLKGGRYSNFLGGGENLMYVNNTILHSLYFCDTINSMSIKIKLKLCRNLECTARLGKMYPAIIKYCH